MSRFVSHPYIDLVLRARVTVLVTMLGAVSTLLTTGVTPLDTAVTALACVLGGLEVGRQLTAPYIAPQVRVSVLVVIVVVIVNLVRLGYPARESTAIVLACGWCAAVIARRATDLAFRPTSRTAR